MAGNRITSRIDISHSPIEKSFVCSSVITHEAAKNRMISSVPESAPTKGPLDGVVLQDKLDPALLPIGVAHPAHAGPGPGADAGPGAVALPQPALAVCHRVEVEPAIRDDDVSALRQRRMDVTLLLRGELLNRREHHPARGTVELTIREALRDREG